MGKNEEIIKELEPLFQEAEARGLWFFNSNLSRWFHPQELREEQAKGKHIWRPVNWKLRDPHEHIKILRGKGKAIDMHLRHFQQRMDKYESA